MKKCPYCAEEIQDDAIVCHYCNRPLTTGAVPTLSPEGVKPIPNLTPYVLLAIAAICGLWFLFSQFVGGGGDNNMIACLNLKISVCSSDGVKGMVTNNCSSKVRIAELQTIGYDSTGSVVDQDPEYVENIQPGGHVYFESLFDDPGEKIKRCTAEITRVV